MNEVQRQAYLKVMGIQTYFPKSVLPGAKRSPVYEISQEERIKPELATVKPARGRISIKQRSGANELASRATTKGAATDPNGASPEKAVTPITTPAQAGAARQVSSAIDDGPEGSSSAPPNEEILEAAVTSEESSDLETENELRFKLRYFRINGQLAIIDEVPHQKSERLGVDDKALLQGILAALKMDVSEFDFRPESFSWPLAENLSMKNHPSVEATRALWGFVKMRQETDRFANLLIFSAQTDSLLMKQKNGAGIRDFAAPGANYFVTVTSSLHSMLACPSLKRDVWQQLQPLRKRLAESN